MVQFNWALYRFAWSVGLTSIAKRHFTIGIKQILAPILYWRFPEFSECLTAIDAIEQDHIKILDIGSPKLLSLFLATKRSYMIYATDLQDQQIFTRYKQHFDDWQSLKGSSGKYIVEFQDARSLQYADNTFDVVFSLEVLGHIPDGGDITAMQEIQRVLKKEGIAIIAVPYANEARELFVEHDVYERKYRGEPVFYLRQYNAQTVQHRLIEPSGMTLLKKIILSERLPFDMWWDKVPASFKIPFMWCESFIARINLKVIDTEALQRNTSNRYKKRMNITLVLKKS